MNQSTVHRRLCELERRLGRRLVERHPTGYRLTEVGEDLRPLAERMETAAQDFERRAAASDADLIGTVRVTCPKTVGYRMMKTSLLDAFRDRYPGLRIELLMVDRVLDLAKGEADIAFRTAPPLEDALVSRKLADVPWAMYASRSYIDRHRQPKRPKDVSKHSVIGFGGAIACPSCRPLAEFNGSGRSRCRSVHDHACPCPSRKIRCRTGSSPNCRRCARGRPCSTTRYDPCA